MKLVFALVLVPLVASCRIDKLLNGAKTPPSQAAPFRVAFASSLASARAGEPIDPPPQVTVQDSAGNVTLRDTLVTLSLGTNPSGDSLRGGRTQVRSVNGVATFVGLRLEKAASGYRLTAAAPKLGADTSAAFSVVPAPATQLLFTAPPSSAMQDSVIKPSVQVTAYDALGNKATNFAGSIRLRIGKDASATKNAAIVGAVAPVVAGVATFPDVRINQVGVGYTLTAAIGSDAPVDTSVSFDIRAAPPPPPPPPTHLGFTQQPPQTAQAGSAITPPVQVAALDAAEHVVQGFTGAIGLTLDPASNGGALSGGAPINAVNGLATFPNLRIDKPGTGYTLRATASPLTDATSRGFDVTAPPSGSITVTTATTGTNAPTSYSVTVDGGQSRTIAANNGTTTYTGLPVNDHTVALTDVPPNCTVTGGASQTVTVTAGGTATAAFSVICSALTGSLTVTTATSGSNQPSGYSVTVDGGQSRSLGLNASTAYTGLTAASHAVQLNGIPANCSVTEANPQTVTVSAGGTAQASFTITCSALTGSVTVSTTTSGPDQPSGYTVAVSGAASQSIGTSGNVTFSGLAPGSHTVTLGGPPSNCTVTGGTSQTVTVTAGGTATAAFTINCAALTGSVTVSTTSSGPDQPSGYTVAVSGGGSQSIGASGSVTFSGLAPGSHTVTLGGAPSNCTVTGGTSQTVTVTAGGTATAAFTINCAALTGSVTVSTTTSGPDQPSGYTVAVSGGGSQSIGTSGSVTFSGLTTGSHTVTLGGAPTNCTVSGGTSQTVTVTAGGTATAAFTINCAALTGSVTVSTTTSGPNQPSGYTVAVSGAANQSIPASGSVTFSGLTTGSHTVTLSGAPSNCSVSGGTSQTVTVTAGGTATAAFTINCAAPNVAPVVNAGPDDRAVTGLLYSFTWSFSDGNHNGPWSYTIDWGDGTTSQGTQTSEGSFSAGHTYIILLPRSFTITVTVTDASRASGSGSKTVSVFLL